MFGPIGTEFTATMFKLEASAVGTKLPLESEPSKALYVVALAGTTAMGSQWFRFRVVAA